MRTDDQCAPPPQRTVKKPPPFPRRATNPDEKNNLSRNRTPRPASRDDRLRVRRRGTPPENPMLVLGRRFRGLRSPARRRIRTRRRRSGPSTPGPPRHNSRRGTVHRVSVPSTSHQSVYTKRLVHAFDYMLSVSGRSSSSSRISEASGCARREPPKERSSW